MVRAYRRPEDAPRVKVVCTLGPASREGVRDLAEAGMDVARINFSHGTRAEQDALFDAVRRTSRDLGRPIGVLADLSGPKIRLGSLHPDPLRLEAGARFVLGPGAPGDGRGTTASYPHLGRDLEPGDRVFVADGAVELRVIGSDGDTLVTEVVRGGEIRSHTGVNAPTDRLSLDPVTPKDVEDLGRAIELGADWIAQSFVRSAEDVRMLRARTDAPVRIVAKIETDAAVRAFPAICDEADAVMVARGDLGVQIPFAEVPVVQKDLVARAVGGGVPVIVATQMLESMTFSERPTRAEASDVANAVWDGTDAVLLSAETAVGEHPVAATSAAAEIVAAAVRGGQGARPAIDRPTPAGEPEAIALAATELAAGAPGVAVIACFTRTGRTAALLSAARPPVPIHAYSPNPDVVRRLTLLRGVRPSSCELPRDTDAMLGMMDERLRRSGLEDGSSVLMVASTPVGRSNTNLLKAHRLGDPTGT